MGKRLIGSVGLKPGTDTGFDLDTKGQIHGYSDTQFALPVGDDDQVLTADSGEASGLKWAAAASGGANTALSNLSSVAVNATIDMNTNNLTNIQFLQLKAALEITINATGVITVTQSYHKVDTYEDASTDDCGTLDGSTTGQIIVLQSAEDARDPTFVDNSGSNPKMILAGNFTCDQNSDKLVLMSNVSSATSEVDEMSRSNND